MRKIMFKSAGLYNKYLKDYIIDDQQLQKLQETGLEMLKDLHDICVENNILYSMAFGTLLGAIRHKNYIPWDDDIDVYMFKKDYQNLKQIVAEKYSDKYYLLDNEVDKNYTLIFPKLIKNDTVLTEAVNDNENKRETGAYIDIFLVDESPKNNIKLKKKLYYIFTKLALVENDYKFPSKILDEVAKKERKIRNYVNLRKFAGFVASVASTRTWLKRAEKIANGKKDEQKYIVFEDVLQVLDRKYFEELELYSFGKYQLYGFKDYDGYLSEVYGDYMQIPPVEKREKHIIVKLELDKKQ